MARKGNGEDGEIQKSEGCREGRMDRAAAGAVGCRQRVSTAGWLRLGLFSHHALMPGAAVCCRLVPPREVWSCVPCSEKKVAVHPRPSPISSGPSCPACYEHVIPSQPFWEWLSYSYVVKDEILAELLS